MSIATKLKPITGQLGRTLNRKSSKHVKWNGTSYRSLYTTRESSYLNDPENKGKGQKGVNFDQLGTWNNRLELPFNLEQSIKAGRIVPEIPLSNTGQCSVPGRRKDNEDRISVVELAPNILMFAIYDGHGGALAVDYAEKHLKEYISSSFEKSREGDLKEILRSAFIGVDAAFTKHLYDNYVGKDNALKSGTTATVCLLRNGVELAVANVGDSRALLCREGVYLALSKEHKPDDPEEKKRIIEKGGMITRDSHGYMRVNGTLEMSRSIGDVDLQQFGVTAEPYIRTLKVRHGQDAFLVLATDGVTYVLTNQEIVDIICTSKTTDEAARFIVDQALHFGSEDNVSALIVPFGAWGKFHTSHSMRFSFGRNIYGQRYQ